MYRLFGLSNKQQLNWSLNEGVYVLGRSEDCDLVINDTTVSRKHARIEISVDKTITLTDLGSHNGTVVNGHKISEPQLIHHSDIILLGRVEIQVAEKETASTCDGFFKVTELPGDLTYATRLPIEKALHPLPTTIVDSPGVLKSISEMGKMLILPGPEKEMFGKALELLREVLPADRLAIFLTEEQNNEISLASCWVADKESSESFSISRTILNDLLSKKNAILISDVQSDTKFAEQQSIVTSNITSVIVVPLLDEGKIWGILYADTTNLSKYFSEEYLRLTAIFGNILAAKISHCNLLKERQAREILESEVKAASKIQEQLLPGEIPCVEGYSFDAFQIQCRMVGGDLYDISELDDGRILFLLADVSGKGIGAALLASNILASFRILYKTRGFDLLQSTCKISEQLLSFSRPGDFATLFIGILDPKTNEIRYVNAGHEPPLLVRQDGNVDFLKASGIPIGALDLITWKEETAELGVGDFLFAFTDGITEATNEKGALFGDKRLKKHITKYQELSPENISGCIMGEIYGFIGDTPRSDDITILIVRRER